MKQEVVITIKYNNDEFDLSVNPKIKVMELLMILKNRLYFSENKVEIISINHKKKLNINNNLYQENIWDGDILEIILVGGKNE